MSEESSAKHASGTRVQREQAGLIFRRLEELAVGADEANSQSPTENTTAPSMLVMSLISDASSLLQGISEGWIDTSQPRIADDLLKAVAELEKTGHTVLAAELILLLGGVSSQGLAAANCQLGRDRNRLNSPPEYSPVR